MEKNPFFFPISPKKRTPNRGLVRCLRMFCCFRQVVDGQGPLYLECGVHTSSVTTKSYEGEFYRASLLTRSAAMQIYWHKIKVFTHEKHSSPTGQSFGTRTWPPFDCFGTPKYDRPDFVRKRSILGLHCHAIKNKNANHSIQKD